MNMSFVVPVKELQKMEYQLPPPPVTTPNLVPHQVPVGVMQGTLNHIQTVQDDSNRWSQYHQLWRQHVYMNGSRWTQEMVWLLLNNLNFEKARDVPLHDRSPLVELETLIERLNSGKKYFDDLEKMSRPRLLRSHLQWTLLPKAIRSGAKQPKIIVVLRGPEDTCASYFHQATVVEGYAGTFDNFCKLFLGGKVPLGPYWKHVTGLWEQRNNPNIMFVKYTQMKTDLAGTIRDVAAFLGKELSEQDVVRMAEFLTFDNLKESKGFNMQHMLSTRKADVNPYIRKGQVGGYKSAMTPEVIEAFQRQSDEILNEIGLSLD